MKCLPPKLLVATILGLTALSTISRAAEPKPYDSSKSYDELTSAEKTAAKNTARKKKLHQLRVCADPGNLPLSNAKGEGYQNKILDVLARSMDTKIVYFWRPYFEQGLAREAFVKDQCDILLDFPPDYENLLSTTPIYRTTYVLATREDRNIDIKDFDDPRLREFRIGVFQHSGMRLALSKHGIIKNVSVHVISHQADLVPEEQPWRQVQEVLDGKLDIAAAWGPFAGWVKKKGEPLAIQPVNLMDDETQLEFDLSMVMRKTDVVLKYMLDDALDRSKDEIKQILVGYGVPLVQCSNCVVSGDIPSHGSYFVAKQEAVRKLYLESLPSSRTQLDKKTASKDQLVTQERLEAWLAEGADLNTELGNAVLASDVPRIEFLLGNGADIHKPNQQGFTPLHMAARQRDASMIPLLVKHGADINARDTDGWTALAHATFRNHVPTIEALIKAGANIEEGPPGFTPLSIAIAEGKFFAAKALIDAGASVTSTSGDDALTPLMVVASQHQVTKRAASINQGPSSVELARMLIAKGADVNARSKKGVTPVMVAASHDNPPLIGLLVQSGADLDAKTPQGKTALDIAKENQNRGAVQQIEVLTLSQKRGLPKGDVRASGPHPIARQ